MYSRYARDFEMIAWSLRSFKEKGLVLDPKKYYVVSYVWSQFAEGITGFNYSFLVYTGDGNGFERKDATVFKNEIKKEIKASHREGTRGKKNYGCGIPGSTGGIQISVKGDKLEAVLDDVRNATYHKHASFHFKKFKVKEES